MILAGRSRQLCFDVGAKSRENTLGVQGIARDQLAAHLGGGKDRSAVLRRTWGGSGCFGKGDLGESCSPRGVFLEKRW